MKNQAQILAESSPVIANLVKCKERVVAGGVYELQTGRVMPIDVGV